MNARGPASESSEPGRPPGGSGEDGQILVMIVGYVLIALLVATVVMAVSAVYIEHKKLLSMADGAAVAAADTYTLGQGEGIQGPSAFLRSERVRSVTESYLGSNDAYARFDRLAIGAGTGSKEANSADVVLTAVAHPPVVSFLLPEGVAVEARSTARSRLIR